MSSRNDSQMSERQTASPEDEHQALVERARVLIADPGYPTPAIVEELARLMAGRETGSESGN